MIRSLDWDVTRNYLDIILLKTDEDGREVEEDRIRIPLKVLKGALEEERE